MYQCITASYSARWSCVNAYLIKPLHDHAMPSRLIARIATKLQSLNQAVQDSDGLVALHRMLGAEHEDAEIAQYLDVLLCSVV